ncbi:MAG: C_GCAxxG_C_C family protein [Dehalococcoidales bacterium]|nr:C_GCAxxG_C_C family protein [Dehalococcoidales bacterium]
MSSDIAQKAYNLGKEYEKTYKGCSQCVVAALQDAFNMPNDDVFKAATGLAAGCGASTDGNCGAYSGGIMFLSMLSGRERDDFKDPSGKVFVNFQLVNKLREMFIREYGSVICRNIQTKIFGRPYYLVDPDEFEKFEKAGAHEIHCLEVVGKGARWTADLIITEGLV